MATTKAQRLDFVKQLYPAALRLYRERDGFHPFFVVAQAALETGWKIKGLSNNLFGITVGSSWTGKTVLGRTWEIFDTANKKFTKPGEVIHSITPEMRNGKQVYRYNVTRLFRAYDSIEECMEDHFKVLKHKNFIDALPYKHNAVEYVNRLVDDIGPKYATDPNYAKSMHSIMKQVLTMVNELGLNDPQ